MLTWRWKFWLFVCFCGLFLVPQGLAGEQTSLRAVRYRIDYATYLGGTGNEQLREVIPTEDGSVLIGGQTDSSDFPVTPGVVQPRYGGEPAGQGHPGIYGGDCLLARLSPDGKKILCATYFGGSRQERNVYGMALDRQGNVVITSSTRSPDLPAAPGAFQSRYGGGDSDWMVVKLSPDFTRLLWCTYVGGSAGESPRGGLALDAEGYVYVVGTTNSSDFPATPGTFQRGRKGQNDAALVKIKPDGSGLALATLLGGAGEDGMMGVSVDSSGRMYVAGHTTSSDFPVTPGAAQPAHGGASDCFLACFSPDASRLLHATYLGGKGNEFAEHRLHLEPDGSVLLTGVSSSPDFPCSVGALQKLLKGTSDGFLTKLTADGSQFAFSTLLGGSGSDFYLMPTPDPQGNVFVVGQTGSADFPVTADALQGSYGGGASDGLLVILSPDGKKLLYATFLGGSGDDLIRSLALSPDGAIYLVGSTTSRDFPVTPGAVQPGLAGMGDGFVVRLVRAR